MKRTPTNTARTLSRSLVTLLTARATAAQTAPDLAARAAQTARDKATAAQTVADEAAAAYLAAMERDPDDLDALTAARASAIAAQDKADDLAATAGRYEAEALDEADRLDRLTHGGDLIVVYRERTDADDEADRARAVYEAAKRSEREALDDLDHARDVEQAQNIAATAAADTAAALAALDLATAKRDEAAATAARFSLLIGATDADRTHHRAQTLAATYRTAATLTDPAAVDREAADLARVYLAPARMTCDKATAAHRAAIRRAAAPSVVVATAAAEAAAREALDKAEQTAADVLKTYEAAHEAAATVPALVLVRVFWNITKSGDHLEAQAQTIAARANKNALYREFTKTQQRIDRAARASDYTDNDFADMIAAAREALAASVAPITTTTADALDYEAATLEALAADLRGVVTTATAARIYADSRAAHRSALLATTDRAALKRRAAALRLVATARRTVGDEARAAMDATARDLAADIAEQTAAHRAHRAAIDAEYKARRRTLTTAEARDLAEAENREHIAAEYEAHRATVDPLRDCLRTVEAARADYLATRAANLADLATRAAFRYVNNYLTDSRAIRTTDRPAPLSLDALAATLADPAATVYPDDEATERARRLREHMRDALPAALDSITPAARRVWELFAKGYSTKATAEKLHRTKKTIQEHLKNTAAALYAAMVATHPDSLEALAAAYAVNLADLATLAATARHEATKAEAARKAEAREATARAAIAKARDRAEQSAKGEARAAALAEARAALDALPPAMATVFKYWKRGEGTRATARALSRGVATISEHRATITRKVRAAALAAAPTLALPDKADALEILAILAD